MGQTVNLECVSYGGNPLATITWFRNGDVIDHSYTTSGRESRNVHTFVARSEDNNAKYSCEARNEMSVETMTAEVTLSVHCKWFVLIHSVFFYKKWLIRNKYSAFWIYNERVLSF